MASNATQIGKLSIANQSIDLLNDTIKIMFVDSAYVHDRTDDFVGDNADAHEINVTGYTPGFGSASRKTIAGKALTRVDPDIVKFTADNPSAYTLGAGATIGGVLYIKEVTDDNDSIVIAFDDTPDLITNGGQVTYVPDPDGILQF